MAAAFLKPRRPHWLGDFICPVAAMIVYIADIALLTTNSQTSGLPLLGAFALLIANQLANFQRNRLPPRSNSRCQLRIGITALRAIVLASVHFRRHGFAHRRRAKDRSAAGMCRALHRAQGCRSHPCDRSDEDDLKNGIMVNYTTYVNDGAALLHRCCTSSDKVLVMDMQTRFRMFSDGYRRGVVWQRRPSITH